MINEENFEGRRFYGKKETLSFFFIAKPWF